MVLILSPDGVVVHHKPPVTFTCSLSSALAAGSAPSTLTLEQSLTKKMKQKALMLEVVVCINVCWYVLVCVLVCICVSWCVLVCVVVCISMY